MSLQVSWKGTKFDVSFAEEYARVGDNWTQWVMLSDLLDKCSAQTGVPTHRIKLLHSGVHMNDPVSTLHRYKLKAGSKIMMIGDDQPISDRAPAPSSSTQASTSTTSYSSTPTPAPAIKQPLTEEDLIAKISTSVNYTNETLLPMIEHYTMVAEQFIRISTASGYTVKHLETEYAKVSETLLQTLIKIDSVDCGEFVQARQHRRDAVKLVQGLMDRVDQVKERVKASTSRNVPPVQL